MAKARNPKPEIRKKSECRSPKGANSATPAAAPSRRIRPPLGNRPVLRSTPTEIAVRSGATAEGGPARGSDFPHAPIPLKTANNQKTAIQQGRGGFTLIEVLVVMAVLTLMAALILPALSRSKLSARRIKCASNLRQIGIAAQMYRDDNGGY